MCINASDCTPSVLMERALMLGFDIANPTYLGLSVPCHHTHELSIHIYIYACVFIFFLSGWSLAEILKSQILDLLLQRAVLLPYITRFLELDRSPQAVFGKISNRLVDKLSPRSRPSARGSNPQEEDQWQAAIQRPGLRPWPEIRRDFHPQLSD